MSPLNPPHSCQARSDSLPEPTLLTEHRYSPTTSSSQWLSQSWDEAELGECSPSSDKMNEYQRNRVYRASSDSSSIYSQPEWEMDPELPDNIAVPLNAGQSTPSAYTRSANKPNTIVEHGWTTGFSCLGSPDISWVDYTESVSPRTTEVPLLDSNTEPTYLQGFEGNTSRIEPECGGQTMELPSSELSSTSLTRSSRPRKPENLEVKKSSFFGNVRDTMARGILEVTSPSRKRLSPSSPKKFAAIQTSPITPKHKEDPETRRSLLKSPVSLSWTLQNPEHSDCKYGPKRFSGAVRSPGLDTPISPRTRFTSLLSPTDLSETLQIGSDQLEEAFSKVRRKLSIKGDSERRRESLKKKIAVIVVPDQRGTLPNSKAFEVDRSGH